MSKSWYAIKNAAAETAEISIYDVIGMWGVSARSFIRDLKTITAKKIDLRIHSPGGDVMEGHAIFNALQRHPATVTTHIDGLAASMASVVALAGKTVNIAANGIMMIHNPSGGSIGGTAEEHRKSAAVLDKIKDVILNAYEEKTGLPREQLSKMMDDDTWMTAQEAKDFGFVDMIGAAQEKMAAVAFDLSAYRNVPAQLRVDTSERSEMKLLAASVATILATASGATLTADSTEAEIKAAIDGLTGDRDKLKKDLDAEKGRATALEGENTTLTNKVTALEGEKTKLHTQLGEATAKITDLEKNAKSAEDHGREIAAAHGSEGTKQDDKSSNRGGGAQPPAGKTHYDAYQAAQKAGDGDAIHRIWNDHGKDIEAYVATLG